MADRVAGTAEAAKAHGEAEIKNISPRYQASAHSQPKIQGPRRTMNGKIARTVVTLLGSMYLILVAACVKLAWDASTICRIFAKTVSSGFFVTSTTIAWSPLMVAPNTSSPTVFSLGIDSPLIEASLMTVAPLTIRPSVGI